MAAGDVFASDAARQHSAADELARRAGVATQLARAFASARPDENPLARTLIELEPLGWSVLPDRLVGRRGRTIDLVLVGPGGVVLLSDTGWTDAVVGPERVSAGGADVTDRVAALADLSFTAQRTLAEGGLAAGEVRPILAVTGPLRRTALFGVTIATRATAVTEIARLGRRLTSQQVAHVRTLVEGLLPPAPRRLPVDDLGDVSTVAVDYAAARYLPAGIAAPMAPQPGPVAGPVVRAGDTLTADQARQALVEGMRRPAIDDWMAFLHPEQARLVRRSFSGPSRIRGAAGTGKTVVALHRAAQLARVSGGRVLLTSSSRILPKALEALMERLAPDVAERIVFQGVHLFALDLLRSRRTDVPLDAAAADRVFKDLWDRTGKDGPLGRIDPMPLYWQDEIRFVLKGRGLADFADYQALPRTGRMRPLGRQQRAQVWELYRQYEIALAEREILDWEDVILEAETDLAIAPGEPFAAVVVDEAQDLSVAMVRLLHRLVGDRPDGLTLVGDGTQTIYPGGASLAEAGVDIQGRGVVLLTDYRHTAEILDFASALLDTDDTVPDVDGAPTELTRPETLRHGPRPVATVFSSRSVHDRSLVERIQRVVTDSNGRTRLGDIGVLALYSWHATEAAEALRAADIPTVELDAWDGRSADAVRVGTIKRAKGLEFAEVLVVRTPPHLVQQGVVDPDEAAAERRRLQRKELYVAMTRAREGLWIGVA